MYYKLRLKKVVILMSLDKMVKNLITQSFSGYLDICWLMGGFVDVCLEYVDCQVLHVDHQL